MRYTGPPKRGAYSGNNVVVVPAIKERREVDGPREASPRITPWQDAPHNEGAPGTCRLVVPASLRRLDRSRHGSGRVGGETQTTTLVRAFGSPSKKDATRSLYQQAERQIMHAAASEGQPVERILGWDSGRRRAGFDACRALITPVKCQ